MQRAVLLGYIPSNPALRTVPPEPADYEPVVLSDEEVERFLEAAKSHRLYALFEMALFTGLRIGELLGLTWADVDWNAGTAAVTKALKDVPGQPLFVGRTKSKAGRRTVLLTDRTIETLKTHRRAQIAERLLAGPAYEDHDLVFCRPTGTFLPPTNAPKQVKRICVKAGLDPMRFHDLRHTHGTMLEADNTDARTIAQRFGHADPAFTVRTYTHSTTAMQRAPVARLNARFSAGAKTDRKPEKSTENTPNVQGS